MKNFVGLSAVVLAAIAICIGFIYFAAALLPAVEMGPHGWAALLLGTVVSLVVGGGLSTILVIGRRRGFDEAAHDLYRDKTGRD